jgi:hypothetical protein
MLILPNDFARIPGSEEIDVYPAGLKSQLQAVHLANMLGRCGLEPG